MSDDQINHSFFQGAEVGRTDKDKPIYSYAKVWANCVRHGLKPVWIMDFIIEQSQRPHADYALRYEDDIKRHR